MADINPYDNRDYQIFCEYLVLADVYDSSVVASVKETILENTAKEEAGETSYRPLVY